MIKIGYLLAFLLVYSSLEQEIVPKLDLASSTVPGTTPSTTSNSTVYEEKLFLNGFGNYKEESSTVLSFDMYLQRSKDTITITDIPKNITFIVEIIYSNRRLRFLEEKVKRTAECQSPSEIENEKIFVYNCKVTGIEEGKKVQKVSASLDTITANGNSISIIPTASANKTCDKINEQTDDKAKKEKYFFRVEEKIEQELKNIIITGNTEEEITDDEIVLSFYENEKENNMTCNVEKLGINRNRYELNCKPKNSIKTNLNGAEIADSSGKNFILDFNKVEDGNIDFVSSGKNLVKNSSSGLSSGAIAGIIIACVALLIATGIVVALCRRSPKPPMEEMNVVTANSLSTLKN